MGAELSPDEMRDWFISGENVVSCFVAVDSDAVIVGFQSLSTYGSLPAGWAHADLSVARAFGNAWIRERRTAVLVVPSVVARKEPISDVFSHHRALSTCHLAGIAARLGRPIQWDPKSEVILNDKLAQSFIARERRKGFDIEV